MVFVWTLCVSPLEIFDVVEKEEKNKDSIFIVGISLLFKEWELLLPEMWGSYLPLFDWSLSSLPKALFYWCGNSFSAWEGKFRTVSEIGLVLLCCDWCGIVVVRLSGGHTCVSFWEAKAQGPNFVRHLVPSW